MIVRQFVAAWRAYQCRHGRHEDVLYSVGHAPGKECRYCHRPGFLTKMDIQEIRKGLPSFLQVPGDDDAVEEKEVGT